MIWYDLDLSNIFIFICIERSIVLWLYSDLNGINDLLAKARLSGITPSSASGGAKPKSTTTSLKKPAASTRSTPKKPSHTSSVKPLGQIPESATVSHTSNTADTAATASDTSVEDAAVSAAAAAAADTDEQVWCQSAT